MATSLKMTRAFGRLNLAKVMPVKVASPSSPTMFSSVATMCAGNECGAITP